MTNNKNTQTELTNNSNEDKINKTTQSATTAITRKKRIPLAEQNRLSSVDTPNGYRDRWVNDENGKIGKFQKGGYELVDRKGSTINERDKRFQDTDWQSSVISQPVGGGITAYLMRIKEEYYQEDQAAKQKKLDESENQMRKSVIPNVKQENTYGEIKINHQDSAKLKDQITDEVIQKLTNKGVI